MTQRQKLATLGTIFSDVLADLAFMFTEDQTLDSGAEGDWLETRIGYRGPDGGDLRLRCTPEFCKRLAANLLGIDPGDDDVGSNSHDAVKEFMNVVCGNFVTAMFGTEKVFNLTIPEIQAMSELPDLLLNDGEHVSTIVVEGLPVQLEHVSCPASDTQKAVE